MNESNVTGKLDQLAGKVKQSIGETTGDQELANSGAAQQVKGNAKEAWGDVKDTAHDVNHDTAATTDTRTEQDGDSVRDKVTSAAHNAKAGIENKLDDVRRDHDRS